MRVKVIKEYRPDDREHILTCEITYWWSWLTGRKDTKQFLLCQAKEDGNICYYRCPEMMPIDDIELREAIYMAYSSHLELQANKAAALLLKEKYEEYFEPPIASGQSYRDDGRQH